MTYTPPKIYGNLYMNNNSSALNTSGGGDTKITGWSAGDSSGTTLSTGSSNITINQSGEVQLIWVGNVGTNGASGIVYYFKIYINNSVMANNKGTIGMVANPESSTLNPISIVTLYNATYGDVFDLRISIANGSDATNRPIIYEGNLMVVGL